MCEAVWKEAKRELMHLLSREEKDSFTCSTGVAVLVVVV